MSTADTATYAFESFNHACAFLDACAHAELPATLQAREAKVDVQVATWKAREKADALAGSAPCVAYEFGKKA